MTESIVLSLIFVAIILLIGYIGASVGIARGFVLTAAIFAGAELALWWGDDAGERLTDWFSVSSATGRFIATMALLLATALLIGLAGAKALGWQTPTRWGALLGGLLGAANGALLIAMSLRLYYLSYSGELTSDPLDESLVTRVLWRNFDWFLLGFVCVTAVLLLYTRFARRPVTVPDPPSRASFSRLVPPPVPRPDQRARQVAQPASYAPTNERANSNGSNVAAPNAPVDETMFAPPPHTAPSTSERVVERTMVVEVQETSVELPSARNTVRFCPNCGMTLDASDRFCPDCGYTL